MKQKQQQQHRTITTGTALQFKIILTVLYKVLNTTQLFQHRNRNQENKPAVLHIQVALSVAGEQHGNSPTKPGDGAIVEYGRRMHPIIAMLSG